MLGRRGAHGDNTISIYIVTVHAAPPLLARSRIFACLFVCNCNSDVTRAVLRKLYQTRAAVPPFLTASAQMACSLAKTYSWRRLHQHAISCTLVMTTAKMPCNNELPTVISSRCSTRPCENRLSWPACLSWHGRCIAVVLVKRAILSRRCFNACNLLDKQTRH